MSDRNDLDLLSKYDRRLEVDDLVVDFPTMEDEEFGAVEFALFTTHANPEGKVT